MLPSEISKPHSELTLRDEVLKKLERWIQKSYFFLTEPTSSKLSLYWSAFMGILVVLVAIFYVLATVDGPNHYTGRENKANYPTLPDEDTYHLIDIILWTPILLDTFFRLFMIIGIHVFENLEEIAEDFSEDSFKKWLNIFDFLSILPLILDLTVGIYSTGINQFAALMLRGLYLLSCSKILRVTKDMTSVLAVRLALGKSMVHLVIPLFFFFVFNVTFGVVLYFLEPCYDLDVCAWKNLFEACFFCVVTMTTTGYGDQVPRYVPARTISAIVMLFGSLFMSMPLAIIGNEYENAWTELKERLRIDQLEQMANEVDEKLQTAASSVVSSIESPRRSVISQDDNNFLKRRKMLRKRLSAAKVDAESERLAQQSILSPLMDSNENLGRVLDDLKNALNESKKMNPSLLLLMCELKGWIAPVEWNIQQSMKELAGTDSIETGGRRMSFFRPFDNGIIDASLNENPGVGNTPLNKVLPDDSNTDAPEVVERDANEVDPKHVDENVMNESQENSTRSSFLSPLKFTKKVAPRLNVDISMDKTMTRQHSFAIRMMRAAPDIANKGDAEDFSRKMDRALENPNSFRTRLWILLEFPHSSKGAKILQVFVLSLILFSVLMLYTQTVPSFGSYGESSDICGKVLHAYCPNKNDVTLDPGCFAHDVNGPTSNKLRYDCDEDDCFGRGYNFGAAGTNLTCALSQPFQTAEELASNFRLPDFLVSRDDMHKLHNVCLRIECTAVEGGTNGNFLWIPVEIFINFCFTLEIVLRLIVADSFYHFCIDFSNIFDILSVVPFYIDVIQLSSHPFDFRIVASSPEPVLLVALKSFKVFRLFKTTRHFGASKVLYETATKAMSQILGILSLLVFIVLMFALFLYEVEKGTECFVGDTGCDLPEENAHEYDVGQRVLIDKDGGVSGFKTVLESLWFSMVTLSSVGYGDFTPVTNLGMLISIVLMLFGAIYLAMPLTVAAATFWSVHQTYVEGNKKTAVAKDKKLVSASFCRKIALLEKRFTHIKSLLASFFDDIQAPDSVDQSKEKKSLLLRCLEIESSLRLALDKHNGDIRRLSAFTISNKEQIARASKN